MAHLLRGSGVGLRWILLLALSTTSTFCQLPSNGGHEALGGGTSGGCGCRPAFGLLGLLAKCGRTLELCHALFAYQWVRAVLVKSYPRSDTQIEFHATVQGRNMAVHVYVCRCRCSCACICIGTCTCIRGTCK